MRQCLPAVGHDTKVGVADTGVGQVDEDLARAWLGSVQLHDLSGNLAWLVIDTGPVFLGNRVGHCCAVMVRGNTFVLRDAEGMRIGENEMRRGGKERWRD